METKYSPGDMVKVVRVPYGISDSLAAHMMGGTFLVILQHTASSVQLLMHGRASAIPCPVDCLQLIKKQAWKHPRLKRGDKVLVYRKIPVWGGRGGDFRWTHSMDRYLGSIKQIYEQYDLLGISWHLSGTSFIFPSGSLLKVE